MPTRTLIAPAVGVLCFMNISVNTQLGLRFADNEVKSDFLRVMKSFMERRISSFNDAINYIEALEKAAVAGAIDRDNITPSQIEDIEINIDRNEIDLREPNNKELRDRITDLTTVKGIQTLIEDTNTKYFLICDSVYECAKRIKINEGFTARTLKDIKFGSYTYLMGKNRMVRFICTTGAIKGIYYSTSEKNAFEFGLDIQNGEYYAPKDCQKEFSMIMQILTFVELGDVEVTILEKGRNNGGKKNIDKVTNSSPNTVFVVDSSWNKLIIRTEGFAVMGHFRLQPCGEAFKDRKLIWIGAFEKHGYKRSPKAKIIHD